MVLLRQVKFRGFPAFDWNDDWASTKEFDKTCSLGEHLCSLGKASSGLKIALRSTAPAESEYSKENTDLQMFHLCSWLCIIFICFFLISRIFICSGSESTSANQSLEFHHFSSTTSCQGGQRLGKELLRLSEKMSCYMYYIA